VTHFDRRSNIIRLERSERPVRREALKHVRVITERGKLPRIGGSQSATVCIAAIAAQGQAIVLVADRAISSIRGGQTVLKADAGVRKIREMAEGWAALISGPLDFGEQIIFDAERRYLEQKLSGDRLAIRTMIEEMSGKKVALPAMPQFAKEAYQVARKNLAVDVVLRPKLLSEQWYDHKVKNQISKGDEFFFSISREIQEVFTESSILLCGFQDGTPEIYILSDPGLLNSASPEGFGVVGIGEDTAKNRIYTLETDPADDLSKVLYDAYDAKESCAEALPDVGHEWDALILVRDRPAVPVAEDVKTYIELLYKRHPRSPFDKPGKQSKDWKRRLIAFSQETLSSRTIAEQRCKSIGIGEITG
jgi:hypothetical protein